MTNGNGGPPTPASGLPVTGGGSSPQGGSLAVGPWPRCWHLWRPSGQANLPVPAAQARRGGAPVPAGGPAPRKGSPFSISNWRVRWRLIAIITVPTVTALILGVIQIVGSVNNYSSFKRVQDLANLNSLVVNAAGLLADERDDTAGYVAAGGQSGAAASVPLKAMVHSDQGEYRPGHAARSPQLAPAVVNGSGYRAQTVLDLSNGVLANITDLKFIRQAATTTKSPALSVITNYDRVIQAFVTFSNDVAAGTGNATLQSDVSVLNALLRMEDDASLQRAYLYQALASTQAGPHAECPAGPQPGDRAAASGHQRLRPGGDGHRAADAEQHRRGSAG